MSEALWGLLLVVIWGNVTCKTKVENQIKAENLDSLCNQDSFAESTTTSELWSVIQNTVSVMIAVLVAIGKNRLNAEIPVHIAPKTRFGQLKNLSNAAVSSRIGHILNHWLWSILDRDFLTESKTPWMALKIDYPWIRAPSKALHASRRIRASHQVLCTWWSSIISSVLRVFCGGTRSEDWIPDRQKGKNTVTLLAWTFEDNILNYPQNDILDVCKMMSVYV